MLTTVRLSQLDRRGGEAPARTDTDHSEAHLALTHWLALLGRSGEVRAAELADRTPEL